MNAQARHRRRRRLLLRVGRGRRRDAHPEPPGSPQRAVGGAHRRADAANSTRIAADRAVRAVILAGEGPVFSAGHDLKEMTAHRADPDRGRAYFADILGRCSAMMQRIVRLPQPVIAAVEGVATAAGCQLVATLRSRGRRGRGALLARRASISACSARRRWWRSRATSRRKHAMEMLLLGEMVGAAGRPSLRARQPGRRRPARRSPRRAGWPRRSPPKSPLTLKIGKRAFYEQREMGLSARLRPRRRGDGGEHAGPRRRGRHRRLHRQAKPRLGGALTAREGCGIAGTA